MKNINVKSTDNLEEILEKESLPISINNELVVLSYEEYLKLLKVIDPEKAKEIEIIFSK